MKASDTVMSSEDINFCGIKNVIIKKDARAIATAQAEISFKAGIREVVEWIEEDLNFDSFGGSRLDKLREEWQAKLKEWGIDG